MGMGGENGINSLTVDICRLAIDHAASDEKKAPEAATGPIVIR